VRFTEAFVHTLRDAPADAEVPSHRLLAQAGFIHKVAAGVYTYAPAMQRVLKRISQIVREEMDRAGAQEVLLPAMQPRSIWEESGRWERYRSEGLLFCLKDRKDADLCLGPTHEEVITKLVAAQVSSYKQLPFNLYQIQTKFRDEIRPRFGLMRAREFIMKDAYSFDADEARMDVSYKKMRDAYERVFSRCGLEFAAVQADAGAIGGSGSEEFVVTASTGEDVFLVDEDGGYAANQDRATCKLAPSVSAEDKEQLPLEEIHTPGVTTIDSLVEFVPGLTPDRTLKAVLFEAVYSDREEAVLVFIRGDRDVNEVKVVNALDALAVRGLPEDEVQKKLQLPAGSIGPANLPESLRVLADESARELKNFVTGLNKKDYHYKNMNWERDCPLPEFHDLLLAVDGDQSPVGDGVLRATRGIEVGHIFKLGTKYSASMSATFDAPDGSSVPIHMGCYGIGITRTAAASVEQNHDERGIIWPLELAPWSVQLVCMNPKDETQSALAEELYKKLLAAEVEVLYDDRKQSPGAKLADADLIGTPLKIIVGRDAKNGEVEFSYRDKRKEPQTLKPEAAIACVLRECAEAIA